MISGLCLCIFNCLAPKSCQTPLILSKISIVDPDWLNPDPGPTFQVNPNLDKDPDPIRIQGFDDQKFKKRRKNPDNFFIFFIKNCSYLSLGLHKGRQKHKRSLHPPKENIQHFKKSNLLSIFVGNFCPPGSGSGYGSGSTTLSRILLSICLPRLHFVGWCLHWTQGLLQCLDCCKSNLSSFECSSALARSYATPMLTL